MLIVEIVRLESSQTGTFGILRVNKQVFCATLEPMENGNLRNISCIPAQPYLVKPIESPKVGGTFQVLNVPERSHILFHIGNFVESTRGCILLGESIGRLDGKRALLNSKKTFKRFLTEVGRRPFHLIIYNAY